MSIGLSMLFGALLCGVGIYDKTKRDKELKEANAKGIFDRIDYTKHHMFVQDLYQDWAGERKMFRKDYIPYLEKNPNALNNYVFRMAQHQEWMHGLRPVEAPVDYDRRTFDALALFDKSRYGEYIRIFNESGTMYY